MQVFSAAGEFKTSKLPSCRGVFFGGGRLLEKKTIHLPGRHRGSPHVGSDILVEFLFFSVKCDLNQQFV